MCLKDGIEKGGTGIRNDGMTEKNPFFKKKREKRKKRENIFPCFSRYFFFHGMEKSGIPEWKNIFSIPSFRLKDGIPSTK